MKKIMIIFLVIVFLVPVTSGNAEILFQENFDDGNYDGWIHIVGAYGHYYPGSWTVTPEGYLQCEPPGAAQDLQLDAFTLPESFVLEFDMRSLIDGGGASLTAWYTHFTDWYNQLAHGYRPGRTYINETLPSIPSWTKTYNAPTGVVIEDWHHIKYIKDGTSVSLYFDGELIYSVTIPVPITDGYFVLTGCPGKHQFDNVFISTIETAPSLEERVELLESQVEELQALTSDHESEIDSLQSQIDSLESLQPQIDALQERLDQLEQSLRDCPTTKHCLSTE